MLEDPLKLVGTTVSDKYEIERVVGEGGFALVYRAKHTVWQRPVALKVFRALGDLPSNKRAGLLDAFIQEGRLLAELSERSAAICQARDVGTLKTPDGRDMPYMVLEWLEGRSLEQITEAEKAAGAPPRTAEQVVRLLEPAAEALALAHRKGIAHRDVKPANIFVIGDPRGEFTVKILDFGIAKVVQDAQRLGGSFQQTSGHVSSFTPAYGAPEQFSRTQGSTGPWTDVFALSLIFTELMTQRGALVGDDLTQLAYSSMDPRKRPTPRTHGVALPDPLEAVLRRAVAVETGERFPTMGAFWEAVRASLGMEALRAFSSVDSNRSSSPSHVSIHSTSLAPQVPAPVVASPVSAPPTTFNRTGPTGPGAPFTSTTQPRSQRDGTLRASGQITQPAPPPSVRSGGGGGLGLALGAIGLVVVLGVAGTAFLMRRSPKGVQPVASASASAVVSAVPTPPPQTCPPGMVKIATGKYFMGSDDKNDEPEERPAHQVTLSAYCIDTTEVTVEAYKACSDRGGCKRAPRENDFPGIDAAIHKTYDPLCNIRDPEGRAKHPINCVDWDLADFYCKAEGKRLPTEAEWEYATRGSDGRKYPWGDDAPSSGLFLNACGNECIAWGKKNNDSYIAGAKPMYAANDGWDTTAPVGSFPKGASQSGLQDVVGNVFEWVSDWKAPYTTEAQTDPKGPATGTERVARGGAWNGIDPAWVRPTYRFAYAPTFRSHGIGFRCAKGFDDVDASAPR